jgi:sugar (glycoside-pentoside-hexuronide) transporter
MNYQTMKNERVCFVAYAFGQCAVYTMGTGYVQLFLTDIGIAAAAVGVILLVARIWDAVNDPMFGVIVDKSKLKGGKYRPWLKLASYLVPLITLALFSIPSTFSPAAKTALAAVLYICWGMSYTVCDIPYYSLATVMTGSIKERSKIVANSRTIVYVCSLLIGIAVPLLYPRMGWMFTGGVIAVVAFTAMIPLGYKAKERLVNDSDELPTLKNLLRALVTNKYLMILLISCIVASLTNTMTFVAGYFAIYNLGSSDMLVYLIVFPALATVFVGLATPAIIKRVDKFYLYLLFMISHILFSFVLFFVGYGNFILFMMIYVIRTTSYTSLTLLLNMFFMDCAEYGRYKTGKIATGVTMSLATFVAKLFNAVAGSLTMFVMAAAGFISGDVATQSQGVVDVLWYMMSFVPALSPVIAVFLLAFGYKLRDKDIQIMAQVNQGTLSREEAEARLSPVLKPKKYR